MTFLRDLRFPARAGSKFQAPSGITHPNLHGHRIPPVVTGGKANSQERMKALRERMWD